MLDETILITPTLKLSEIQKEACCHLNSSNYSLKLEEWKSNLLFTISDKIAGKEIYKPFALREMIPGEMWKRIVQCRQTQQG